MKVTDRRLRASRLSSAARRSTIECRLGSPGMRAGREARADVPQSVTGRSSDNETSLDVPLGSLQSRAAGSGLSVWSIEGAIGGPIDQTLPVWGEVRRYAPQLNPFGTCRTRACGVDRNRDRDRC